MENLINFTGGTSENDPLMVSSRLIAEKTGKQHSHVVRDIKVIIGQLGAHPSLDENSIKIKKSINPISKNENISEILLDEKMFTLVITGYSVHLRLVLIEEFKRIKEELEKRDVIKPPTNFLEALEFAKMIEEKRLLLVKQIEEDKPKVEFYNTVSDIGKNLDFKEACSTLKLSFGRNTLFQKLREGKVLMHDNLPYRKYIEAGYFEVYERLRPTKDFIDIQTVITQKGLIWLDKNRQRFHLF